MASVEKVSVALTSDMLTMVRKAVASGDYASSSEVIREALRHWKAGRISAPASAAQTDAPPLSVQEVLRLRHERLVQLCGEFGVRRLGQFGSSLREDFDPATSDIDLVVEFDVVPGHAPARQYFGFKAALEELLGYRVDLVELASMPESRLRRIIERTQRPLYDQAA